MLVGGLVLHWAFDETSGDIASDSSGNGNDGTPSGHTWRPAMGVIDGAIEIPGAARGADAASPTLAAVDDVLSFAVWLRYLGTTPTSFQNVAVKIDFGATPREGWQLQSVADSLDMQLRLDTSVDSNQTLRGYPSALDGAWHHIAFTADSGAVTTYMDGAMTRNAAYNHGNGLGNSGEMIVGASSGIDALYDDARYYDRVLTAEQIAALHACGPP